MMINELPQRDQRCLIRHCHFLLDFAKIFEKVLLYLFLRESLHKVPGKDGRRLLELARPRLKDLDQQVPKLRFHLDIEIFI